MNRFIIVLLVFIVSVLSLTLGACSNEYDFLDESGYTSLSERRITRSAMESGDNSSTGDVEQKLIFPDRTEISGNAYIANQMKDAWQATIDSCNSNGRREIGFYIYCNPKTGEIIENVKIVVGEIFPNDVDAKICVDLGDRNDTPDCMACGVFHTHTSLYYFDEPCSREVGPSIIDRNTYNAQTMPCFVYDYCYNIDNNTPIGASAMVYYYGRSCRKK